MQLTFPFPHAALQPRAGIGLRAAHYREVIETQPHIGWLEVHSENYFGRGGQPLHILDRVRERYALSLHGVGLSLGSVDGVRHEHLVRLKALMKRYEPTLMSDHLCWGAIGGYHLNDLLPLPYTEEALDLVCANVGATQDFLGRQILVENVSSYLQYFASSLSEWDFLAEVARRTGCGILLDVNNIYVSAVNHGFDPLRYLDAIPAESVGEIHLAGFDNNGRCLIDTHGKRVAGEVWNLFGEALTRIGPKPTLIEWDTDVPALSVLLDEAQKAADVLDQWRATADLSTRHALAA